MIMTNKVKNEDANTEVVSTDTETPNPETMQKFTDETCRKFTPEYANYLFNVLNVDPRDVKLEEGENDFSLSLTVIMHGVPYANAYYRWGGFGESVADLSYLLTKYRRMPLYPKESPIAFLVRMLSLTGAGFRHDLTAEERFTLIDCNYPLTNGKNDGIIEIMEEGMKRNDECAKYHVTLNYDKRTIDLHECFTEMTQGDMDEQGFLESDIVDYPFDSFVVKFKNVVKLRTFMREVAERAKLVRHNDKVYKTMF